MATTRIIALLCGLLFGAGLAASGMTNTYKVTGFLDIFGNWDPDLLYVMGAAVLVTVIAFPLILRRASPVLSDVFVLPSIAHIDKRILGGAALFGVGWGLFGYCPGPALAALVYLEPVTLVFVVAMGVGMFIGNKV
jgi:uncharacterized membrane protein YedE/YeeE